MKFLFTLSVLLLSSVSAFAADQCKVHLNISSVVWERHTTQEFFNDKEFEESVRKQVLRLLCAVEVKTAEEADANLDILVQLGQKYENEIYPTFARINQTEGEVRHVRGKKLFLMQSIRELLEEMKPCAKK